MTIFGYKRLTMGLGVVCAVLLLGFGLLYWNYSLLHIRVAFATDQVKIFDQIRTQALRSGPEDAAGCLDYVVNYYPSGSKQETGSHLDRLDRIVEQVRMHTTRDIVTYLRTKTGDNLGEDPKAWIQKYAR